MREPAPDAVDLESRWPGQLVGIDLGSNSFRLEIGQWIQGRYRRIDYLKETVRLGEGLDPDGMLTPEAAQRGLDCLMRFAARLKGYVPEQVRQLKRMTVRRYHDTQLCQQDSSPKRPV